MRIDPDRRRESRRSRTCVTGVSEDRARRCRSGGSSLRISAGAYDAVAWARWGGGRGRSSQQRSPPSRPPTSARTRCGRGAFCSARHSTTRARYRSSAGHARRGAGRVGFVRWRKGDEVLRRRPRARRRRWRRWRFYLSAGAPPGARDERHEAMGHSGNRSRRRGSVPIAARSRVPGEEVRADGFASDRTGRPRQSPPLAKSRIGCAGRESRTSKGDGRRRVLTRETFPGARVQFARRHPRHTHSLSRRRRRM